MMIGEETPLILINEDDRREIYEIAKISKKQS
jgi:hypothetical protein